MRTHSKRVQVIGPDAEGYDAILAKGWQVSPGSDCHTLIRPTASSMIAAIRAAVPCTCTRCTE